MEASGRTVRAACGDCAARPRPTARRRPVRGTSASDGVVSWSVRAFRRGVLSVLLCLPLLALFADTALAQGVTVSFKESALSVEEAAGTLSVPVVLSQARSEATTLSVVTTASTADANADYGAGPYSVTIPANETQGTVDITILDDATPESAETFLVSLTDPPPA